MKILIPSIFAYASASILSADGTIRSPFDIGKCLVAKSDKRSYVANLKCQANRIADSSALWQIKETSDSGAICIESVKYPDQCWKASTKTRKKNGVTKKIGNTKLNLNKCKCDDPTQQWRSLHDSYIPLSEGSSNANCVKPAGKRFAKTAFIVAKCPPRAYGVSLCTDTWNFGVAQCSACNPDDAIRCTECEADNTEVAEAGAGCQCVETHIQVDETVQEDGEDVDIETCIALDACNVIANCDECDAVDPRICATCADDHTYVAADNVCPADTACSDADDLCVECDAADPRICLACSGGATVDDNNTCVCSETETLVDGECISHDVCLANVLCTACDNDNDPRHCSACKADSSNDADDICQCDALFTEVSAECIAHDSCLVNELCSACDNNVDPRDCNNCHDAANTTLSGQQCACNGVLVAVADECITPDQCLSDNPICNSCDNAVDPRFCNNCVPDAGLSNNNCSCNSDYVAVANECVEEDVCLSNVVCQTCDNAVDPRHCNSCTSADATISGNQCQCNPGYVTVGSECVLEDACLSDAQCAECDNDNDPRTCNNCVANATQTGNECACNANHEEVARECVLRDTCLSNPLCATCSNNLDPRFCKTCDPSADKVGNDCECLSQSAVIVGSECVQINACLANQLCQSCANDSDPRHCATCVANADDSNNTCTCDGTNVVVNGDECVPLNACLSNDLCTDCQNDSDPRLCLNCANDAARNGDDQCVCDANFTEVADACVADDECLSNNMCLTCVSSDPNDCETCVNLAADDGSGQCVCDAGSRTIVGNECIDNLHCIVENNLCTTCSAVDPRNCTNCSGSNVVFNGDCVDPDLCTESGHVNNPNDTCESCDASNPNHCATCTAASGHIVNGDNQCVPSS